MTLEEIAIMANKRIKPSLEEQIFDSGIAAFVRVCFAGLTVTNLCLCLFLFSGSISVSAQTMPSDDGSSEAIMDSQASTTEASLEVVEVEIGTTINSRPASGTSVSELSVSELGSDEPSAPELADQNQSNAKIDVPYEMANSIRVALDDWAEAWSAKDADGYLSHYSQNFVSEAGLNIEQWRIQGAQRLAKPEWIQVAISNIEIEALAHGTRVEFFQEYSASSYADNEIKVITFEQVEGSWKILAEHSLTPFSKLGSEIATDNELSDAAENQFASALANKTQTLKEELDVEEIEQAELKNPLTILEPLDLAKEHLAALQKQLDAVKVIEQIEGNNLVDIQNDLQIATSVEERVNEGTNTTAVLASSAPLVVTAVTAPASVVDPLIYIAALALVLLLVAGLLMMRRNAADNDHLRGEDLEPEFEKQDKFDLDSFFDGDDLPNEDLREEINTPTLLRVMFGA